MRVKIFKRLFFIVVILSQCIVPVYAADEVVVIVNKSNPVSALTLDDVKEIYNGRMKSWSNNEPVTLFLPPEGGAPLQWLAEKVFSKNKVSAVNRFYLKSLYQQTITEMPLTSTDPVSDVKKTSGGVALVNAADVAGSREVKVIHIGMP